jgi:hypothetical protein
LDAVRAQPERDPIVVFGAPRSGTTYLEQILNAHPAVFISHETRVFAWLHHALVLTQDHRLLAIIARNSWLTSAQSFRS